MNQNTINNIIRVLIAFIVVSLAVLAFAFYQFNTSALELEQAEENKIDSYLVAYQLQHSSDLLTKYSRSYAMTGNPEYKRRYYHILDIRNGKKPRPENYHRIYWDLMLTATDKPRPDGKAEKLTDVMKRTGFTEAEFKKLAEANKISDDLVYLEEVAMNAIEGKFEGDKKGVFDVRGAPNREVAIAAVYGKEFHDYKKRIMQPIDDVFVMMEKRTGAEISQAKASETFAAWLFGLSALATLLFTIALLYFNNKLNSLRLIERQEAQQKAEAENEQLNNSVINILQTMNQLSQRDLTAKAPVTEDIIGTVSDSVNALTAETSKVLLDVTDVAQQVNAASQKVKEQAQLVSQTAEDERENVTQMANALSHSSESMTEVASLTDSSNDSARKAALATQDALDTVKTTVNEMESIRETISQTEKRIKRLGERSQEISGIVGLINTISERTHVLALNASMQAAVAGEAGRGFAVVAEEVQRLAESSRNATEQIESLVKNIQIDTNETINTVNETIARVVKGSEEAEKAGEQMARTRDITAELVAQVIQISQAIEEQKATSDGLLKSVQEIGMGAENTARQIDEQNRETEQLQTAAKQLVESVGVFKLPNRAA